jgi:hypothetical protein
LAQVRPVTSETLEAQIRNLLPSQNGFSEDLQASNVITPIIDLTAAAQGTQTPQYLQTALAFGSQTGFEVVATSTNIATTPGFYRVVGVVNVNDVSAAFGGGFNMSDGFSTKQVWASLGPGTVTLGVATFDLTFFVASGITLSAFSDGAGAVITGSTRQVADVNGNLVNPSGFTPQ